MYLYYNLFNILLKKLILLLYILIAITILFILMCGIWALFKQTPITEFAILYNAFMKIKHRGPEYSTFSLITPNTLIGFHRLAIMDISAEGNQPFYHVRKNGSCIYCICNGEIYDHWEIKDQYDIITKSHSDCEIIIPLYEKIGIMRMMHLLGSEFAFILIDISKDKTINIVAGRDPFGVKPLFIGMTDNSICLSSEIKGIDDGSISVFPPGHYLEYNNGQMNMVSYYSYIYQPLSPGIDRKTIYYEIRCLLMNAVRRRLMGDRPFGVLLSGGFDSSMICGLAKLLMPDKKFPVFTISFPDGTDLPYAKIVAEDLELEHHIIEVIPDDALKEIEETIYAEETWDITTIRAGVMQRIAAKYISKNTNVRVLLCGENSDEVHGSYRYFLNAPTKEAAKEEAIRLVKNVHLMDGLRTERTTAYHGLEVRLPFADIDYVDYIFSLDAEYIMPYNGIEKYTIRQAFSGYNIIPEVIINRPKEALSDGVSGTDKSWYQIIQTHIESLVSDEEYEANRYKYTYCPPFTKESYYYRKVFCKYFGEERTNVIPYYWMPKWSPETKDPSARVLVYKNEGI